MKRAIVLLIAFAAGLAGAGTNSIVERAGATAFIQVKADSFRSLTPKQQALAYWLSQAAIAIDPIIYDQQSRFGLRQKRLLEALMAHPRGVDTKAMDKIAAFTKLFWANRGNHNATTAQKFLPGFTYEELKAAGLAAIRNHAPGLGTQTAFLKELDELRPSLFDPNFEPLTTAKSPRGGLDILQASANNFYSGVKLSALAGFHEKYPLNSRLVETRGKLVEQVYRAGTPDGKIPHGLYSTYLNNAIQCLERARSYAEPDQVAVISALIRYYQTGDPKDWLDFGTRWVQNNPPVDFVNGFVEVYMDARGAKGTSQAFVSVTDDRLTTAMRKIADNAQYFEDRAPWLNQYKKQGVKPPLAKAVETVIETGDFHVNTIGDNLPNENAIHEKYGSKSFMLVSSSRAIEHATGRAAIDEFGYSKEIIDRNIKYGDEAEDLMTALHEIVGHGSGKLNPRLTHDAAYYLKEYASTLEEARADLMALWNASDPKLKELGLISSPEVAKAMYDRAAMAMLTQLRSIPHGNTIEEDHARDRQLIAAYIQDKTGAIVETRRGGKTYVYVKDYSRMRQGVGMLLKELMRIKAEGDYAAIKALIDRYGVRFDPKLRDEVVARYDKLNLPTYWAGIYPALNATIDAQGRVTKVEMTEPRGVIAQYLRFADGPELAKRN